MAGIGVLASPVSSIELWYVDVDDTASSNTAPNLWKRVDTLTTTIGSTTYSDPHNYKGGGPWQTNNALIDCVISEEFNHPRRADLIVANRAFDPYSSTASERYGPLTDTFREGMEILLLNHSTNTVLFRGYIWDIDKHMDEMTGGTIDLTCFDSLQDIFDIPIESLTSFSGTGKLAGDERKIPTDGETYMRASGQILELMGKYKGLAEESGNPRFYHFYLPSSEPANT